MSKHSFEETLEEIEFQIQQPQSDLIADLLNQIKIQQKLQKLKVKIEAESKETQALIALQ